MTHTAAARSHLSLVRNHSAVPDSLRLLCVDDEEDIRMILELALTLDPGITAEVVPDGATMLERAHAGEHDAFILDAMMPGIDGYELCRRLKADSRTAAVPVIFLTAKAQRDELDRAHSLGAIACLKKPFDPMTLAADIRGVLAGQ